MGIYYAIGGGNFQREENLHIDKMILKEVGVNPKLLYIPAASNDKEEGIKTVVEYFQKLNANVKVLKINEMHCAKKMFDASDIIYFGGGMTKRLVDVASKFNLKELIIDACQKGKVIAGISAGAIMLFEHGFGDQYAFNYREEMKGYRYVDGLGIIKGVFVPHYQAQGLLTFHDEVQKYPMTAYALEDKTALRIEDGKFNIIKQKGAMAVRFNYEKNYLLEPLLENEIYDL